MYNCNCNPETSIRYGVISGNDLDPDVFNELFYGPQAVDLSYQAALDDLRAEAVREWDNYVEQAEIAADEVDPGMSDSERETFIENKIEDLAGTWDRDWFIEREVERSLDYLEIDEPTIEGEYDGVKYRISWLGGAPIVFLTEGPQGYCESLCSPCVPGAANVRPDNYKLLDELASGESAVGYLCYCPPREWLYKEFV